MLACTSRYWFNYRHVANTLAMYRTVKRLGVPDERIVLMLGDDVACDARNALAPAVYAGGAAGAGAGSNPNLYGESIEVDYRGYEASSEVRMCANSHKSTRAYASASVLTRARAQALLRVLTGRHPPGTPRSRTLPTDAASNVLVFLSGHGGDEFLKFLDKTEASAHDFASAVAQMRAQRRFNEMLFMVDTCQVSGARAPARSARSATHVSHTRTRAHMRNTRTHAHADALAHARAHACVQALTRKRPHTPVRIRMRATEGDHAARALHHARRRGSGELREG